MIAGMVDQLSRAPRRRGRPAEDWARLIRSLGVLGRSERGGGDLAARRASCMLAIAAGLATIEAAARDAGIARVTGRRHRRRGRLRRRAAGRGGR